MPVIGHRLTRRVILALGATALARAADPAEEAWEVVTAMAAALGRGSDGEFLAMCDASLHGYAELRGNVAGLVAAAEIESGIDPVKNEGDGAARVMEIDWLLHLVERGLDRVTRRRQVVKCRMEKRSRKWKVVALEPVAFFAPPSAGMDLADQRRARRLLR
jgi:hypothetical protein